MPETVAPMLSDEAVTKATGRGWQEWFGLLDAWWLGRVGALKTLLESEGAAG